ncbi:trihelix transcription factor GTL1-like [Ctenocephalides felis]|uniref:trihelix transcription factor GTL1-like n=1 Tax=Ctenocephalides felis TaxID=7515 RepID=UPI000E6E2A76|nr:trihelix transcription factor GTL1-like [Ctenocephalides felis]
MRIESEESAFKWPHEAILLLLDEYEKRQMNFISGKMSQKKLWQEISAVLNTHGYIITGPQCLSKFSGMKKTYKKIRDHNNKSGNSAKHRPYLTVRLIDDLIENKPSITPVSTCSSTGKKRTLSEASCGSSSSSNMDIEANRKKAKSTPASDLIAALEERSRISEENEDRRFREYMAFKEQKAKESNKYKQQALELLEKLLLK